MSEEPGQEPRVRLEAPGENQRGQAADPPRPAAPSPDNDPQISRAGRRSLWLGIAALLMVLLGTYLGLIMGIVALYVGIRTLRAARRSRSRAPGAVPGIVLASVTLVLSLMGMAFQALFWNELQTYSKCMSAANTITDENQCKNAFAQALEKRLHLAKGSLGGGKYL